MHELTDQEIESLRHSVVVTGEMALGLDDRDPRGIYVQEDEILEGSSFGRVACKVLHGHGERRTEPALDTATQEQIGTATYCSRCGNVLSYDVEEPKGENMGLRVDEVRTAPEDLLSEGK